MRVFGFSLDLPEAEDLKGELKVSPNYTWLAKFIGWIQGGSQRRIEGAVCRDISLYTHFPKRISKEN